MNTTIRRAQQYDREPRGGTFDGERHRRALDRYGRGDRLTEIQIDTGVSSRRSRRSAPPATKGVPTDRVMGSELFPTPTDTSRCRDIVALITSERHRIPGNDVL